MAGLLSTALVRTITAPNYADLSEAAMGVTNRGEQLMVQALPELTEVVRLGGSYQVQLATGIAALTAFPTTVAGLSLYNGEPSSGGKSYIIDSFGSWEGVADVTQANATAIFAMQSNVPLTAVPTATALTVRSMIGKPNYGGAARAITTLTVTNDGWFPHAGTSNAVPTAGGLNFRVTECLVHGLYIVRPGGMFNVQAVKSLAAAAAQQFFFIRWHEVLLAIAS